MTSIRQRISRGLSAIRPHMSVLAVAVLLVATLIVPASVFAAIDATTVVENALTDFISPIWNIAQMGIALACVVMALMKGVQAARGQSQLWLQAILLFVVAVIVTIPATVAGIFSDDLADCVQMLEVGTGQCDLLG